MSSVPMPAAHQVTYVTQGYVVNAPSNAGAEKYATTFYKLGVVQIVFAFLYFVFGVAILAFAIDNQSFDYLGEYYDGYAYVGVGIWASAFFFASGILGVLQGKKKTRCLLVAALTMTIFSAIIAASVFSIEMTAAICASYFARDYYWRYYWEEWNVSLGIHSTLCFLGFAEMVTSIVHSAYCCGVQCCQNNSVPVQATTSHTYVNPGHLPTISGQSGQGLPIATVTHDQTPHPQSANYQASPMQEGYVTTQSNFHPFPDEPEQPPPPSYQQSAIKG